MQGERRTPSPSKGGREAGRIAMRGCTGAAHEPGPWAESRAPVPRRLDEGRTYRMAQLGFLAQVRRAARLLPLHGRRSRRERVRHRGSGEGGTQRGYHTQPVPARPMTKYGLVLFQTVCRLRCPNVGLFANLVQRAHHVNTRTRASKK